MGLVARTREDGFLEVAYYLFIFLNNLSYNYIIILDKIISKFLKVESLNSIFMRINDRVCVYYNVNFLARQNLYKIPLSFLIELQILIILNLVIFIII